MYVAVCKIIFTPLSSDDDECVPGNLGALRLGLEALALEDARDFVRAREAWNEVRALLIEEKEDDLGPGATGSLQIDDDHGLALLNEGYCSPWGWGT